MSYYQQPRQYSGGGYISPQHLSNMTNANMNLPSISTSHPPPHLRSAQGKNRPISIFEVQHAHHSAKGTQGIKLQDVGLQAGARHQLSHDPIPTPQSILDGSYQAALQSNERDVVTYVPRLPQHSGAPSLPSIVFCLNGKPGPYLNDITKKRVILDGAYDLVLKDRVWKQTSLTIDWPGVKVNSEYIPCVDKNNCDLTRTDVAQIVARSLVEVFMMGKKGEAFEWGRQVMDTNTKAWDLRKMDYRDVRLIGINYYRKTWIPVLAVDA